MTSEPIDLLEITIKEFHPRKSSRGLWNKYHQLNEELLKEIYPKDKLPSREFIETSLISGWPDYYVTIWLIYKDKTEKELIGRCSISYIKESSDLFEENKEIGNVYIIIKKDLRKQGIGSKILLEIISKLKEKGCKYFQTTTYYPSGMRFSEKLGAKLTNIETQNRLYLDDVNWLLVEKWIIEGKKGNPDVKIENFFGVSEEDVDEYCEVMTELENEAPTLEDDEDQKFKEIYTPKRYREFVEEMDKRKFKVFTFRTREVDGTISGMTEIFFSNDCNPERISVGLTGVKKNYRGKGIGKWLKASMMLYIKDNLLDREYIVTGNADHNAPMLSINNRLGFKPYLQRRDYKFSIDKILKLL